MDERYLLISYCWRVCRGQMGGCRNVECAVIMNENGAPVGLHVRMLLNDKRVYISPVSSH